MPDVDRNEIKKRVVHNLSILSGFAEDSIEEHHKLAKPGLWLSEDARGNLAPGFQVIASEHDEDARITKTECKKLKTVAACVTLVFKRAGGQ